MAVTGLLMDPGKQEIFLIQQEAFESIKLVGFLVIESTEVTYVQSCLFELVDDSTFLKIISESILRQM